MGLGRILSRPLSGIIHTTYQWPGINVYILIPIQTQLNILLLNIGGVCLADFDIGTQAVLFEADLYSSPARSHEEAWLSAWKQVYIREPQSDHDIVAEMRSLTDLDARLSVPMVLDGLENAEAAKRALSTAYNHKDVIDLRVYTLGDGGVMSGLLVAGQRSNGETTFLVFLYD